MGLGTLAIFEISAITIVLIMYVAIYNSIGFLKGKIKGKYDIKPFEYDNYDNDFREHSNCLERGKFNIAELEKNKFQIERTIDDYERRYHEHVIHLDSLNNYFAIIVAVLSMVFTITLSVISSNTVSPLITTAESNFLANNTLMTICTTASTIINSDGNSLIDMRFLFIQFFVILILLLHHIFMRYVWHIRNKTLLVMKAEILSQKLRLVLIEKEIAKKK